jgi:hypothetical protein
MSFKVTGPQGFWCRFCGKYQSCRNSAQVKAAKAHHVACSQSPDLAAKLNAHDAAIIDEMIAEAEEARQCVGCFQVDQHARGCPTGANGTPNYS